LTISAERSSGTREMVVCHPHPRVLTVGVLIVAQIFGGVLKREEYLIV
jgi:hypothetical protein